MSNGMWTKHVTEGGKVFYYNAEQSRSLWQPPTDSLVHEAPYLKPILSSLSPPSSSIFQQPKPLVEAPASNSSDPASLDSTKNEAMAAELIDAALSWSQTAIAPVPPNPVTFASVDSNPNKPHPTQPSIYPTTTTNKRFKKRTLSEGEGEGGGAASEYLRQKSELQKMMGGAGDDDASKWLVR
eukprot:gene33375-40379_t